MPLGDVIVCTSDAQNRSYAPPYCTVTAHDNAYFYYSTTVIFAHSLLLILQERGELCRFSGELASIDPVLEWVFCEEYNIFWLTNKHLKELFDLGRVE